MVFNIEKALFINCAPFEHLELNFKEKGINVLCGINGKGKTTILSFIVDAFYELARPYYANEFEGKSTKYYRVISPLDVLDERLPSIVYFEFSFGPAHKYYINISNKCTKEQYEKYSLDIHIPFENIQNSLEKDGCVKFWDQTIKKNDVNSIFNNNILTYFPAYRFEIPGYLNSPYKRNLSFKTELGMNGYLPNQLEVITDIHQLTNWLMDLLLDLQIYKDDGWAKLRNSFNLLLSSTLSSKVKSPVRIGIGPRNNAGSRISVVKDLEGGYVKTIYPTIFNVSSGEISILSLFGELLRQADNISELLDVNGIVMIDEIDKHLHIKLQKEILPKLIELFPNIQFIISSHSPFFNMGLADNLMERTQIIDLDNNGIVCEPTNNDLYREVYEMMISENDNFAVKYRYMEDKLKSITKPLVITEGKTDIKFILKAKEKLGLEDIDFDVIDSDQQPDGDSNLQKLLQQLSKVKNAYPIIGIFDRDLKKTVDTMESTKEKYKNYGNNVYGFCIPVPPRRRENNQTEISIEYLFSDKEIMSPVDKSGRHLFIGTQFSKESGRCNESKDLILKMPDGRGCDKILENNGGQAVLDIDDNNLLAKKNEFAEAVKSEFVTISSESWENFRPILEKIKILSEIEKNASRPLS